MFLRFCVLFIVTMLLISVCFDRAEAHHLPCAADVDRDGVVTVQDMALIASKIGSRDRRYDLDFDRRVTRKDVDIASRYFLRSC